MRFYSSVFGSLTILTTIIATVLVGQAAAEPQLSIPKATHDFGTVLQGTKVTHDFEIKNTGDAPLAIKGIQPGCGCTVANLEKQSLAPGESAMVKATFDTANFQGHKVKTIRLLTNDPKSPAAVIGLQGDVRLDVNAEPNRVYFGRVQRSAKLTKEVLITPGSDSSTKILEIDPRSEFIAVSTADVGKGKKLTISLKENVPVGVLRTRVVVKTSSDLNPLISIPVFARVEGDLVANPPDVSFGLLELPLKEKQEQTVELKNSSARPVKVLSVDSADTNIKTSFKEITPGKEYQVVVSLTDGASGQLRSQVKVTTDNPAADQKELIIPVYGILSHKGK